MNSAPNEGVCTRVHVLARVLVPGYVATAVPRTTTLGSDSLSFASVATSTEQRATRRRFSFPPSVRLPRVLRVPLFLDRSRITHHGARTGVSPRER